MSYLPPINLINYILLFNYRKQTEFVDVKEEILSSTIYKCELI
jgi:hypothetical protein